MENVSVLFCNQWPRSISVLLIHVSRNILKIWEHLLQHYWLESHHRLDYAFEPVWTHFRWHNCMCFWIAFTLTPILYILQPFSCLYVFLFHLYPRLISVTCGQDKSMRLLWLWRIKDMRGWESRLSTVRLSCGRLSLSSTPLGLISSACLQREGDPQGRIITQATASLQRCSLHWSNPQYTLPLLCKQRLYTLSSLYFLRMSSHIHVYIFILNAALNPFDALT